MAKAFKCDRCSGYFDSKSAFSGADLSGQGLMSKLRSGWYPESVDICRECAELVRVFLAKWWADEEDV